MLELKTLQAWLHSGVTNILIIFRMQNCDSLRTYFRTYLFFKNNFCRRWQTLHTKKDMNREKKVSLAYFCEFVKAEQVPSLSFIVILFRKSSIAIHNKRDVFRYWPTPQHGDCNGMKPRSLALLDPGHSLRQLFWVQRQSEHCLQLGYTRSLLLCTVVHNKS